MKSPIQEFSDDLDHLIKIGSSVDEALGLPGNYVDNLEVDVICTKSIYNFQTERDGLHFITKLVVEAENIEVFCRITSGDNGRLIDRSNFTKNMKELLISSEDDWNYFEDGWAHF